MARQTRKPKTRRRDYPLLRPRTLIVPRLLRRGELSAYLNVSCAALDLLRLTPDFPRPIVMPSTRSPSGVSRVPLWDRQRIDSWIDQQQLKGDTNAA
jgi:hypothetical protein